MDEHELISYEYLVDWTTVDGFEEKTHKAITHYFMENADMVLELLEELEVKIEEINEYNGRNFAIDSVDLQGKTFCITGKLERYANRDALVSEIEARNGKYLSGVSSKLNYLINNDKTSTSGKNKKAMDLGIEIISEADFMQMCHIVDISID